MSYELRDNWIEFYSAFAIELLKFKSNRKALIDRIKVVFRRIGISLPKLEKNNDIVDIDPFTVFGLFNKGLTDQNRLKIISGFADEFSIEEPLPENFDGIPVFFSKRATFYNFLGERNDNDIDNLWSVFECAVNFADNPTEQTRNSFIACYDAVLSQIGILWNLSMGLFWIRPNAFIDLDSKSRDFLSNPKYMPSDIAERIKNVKSPPSGKEYLEICDLIASQIHNGSLRYSSFTDISFNAYNAEDKFKNAEYWPSKQEYNPGMTVKKWINALSDSKIAGNENIKMLRMMLELDGESTCANLAAIYGNTAAHYNMLGSGFGKRVSLKFECPECIDNGEVKYFTVPFVGRPVIENGKQRYSWKLRSELEEALGKMDFDDIETTPQKVIRPATIDKNIILYGPPGTGKTYNTVNYAVAIIENSSIANIKSEDYTAVKRRYDEYKANGLIEFVTFHQSFGYEEFIEGIRPIMDNDDEVGGDIKYAVVNGIFKEFCEKSFANAHADIGLNKNPTVWKVSLGGTYDNDVRTECMKNSHIRIGYDSYGESISDATDFSKNGGKNVLNTFINKMRKGDVVLSCYSASDIDAIGIVDGDYVWSDNYAEYKRVRGVKWIVKGISENIVEMNNGKTMTLPAAYKLSISLNDVFEIIDKHSNMLTSSNQNAQNRVFIIDEINRGNISKVFGELITLIEPSKRLGADEELRVRLPYSNQLFGIPDNIYLIGTMNTADRSIATVDTALRRRFSFEEMMPNPDYLRDVQVEGLSVETMLNILNERIEALYDREHTIGHAYFKEVKENPTLRTLGRVFSKRIIPLLQEYFFEDYEKIRLVLGDNQKRHEEPIFICLQDVGKSKLFGNFNFDEDKKVYRVDNDACYDIDAYCMLR